ncbi:hypothetical protein ASPVEDRAFT_46796 [Aspergillus versicolor CBS 583.65]|uniref:NmrA-like domain-containing protein n=1 Tax=Aspergillus versicolor CBS 583.65 TaxID=1036611 RepID=A0A1L9Q156_ASPVE|nr:uncharacterized protein ASPVEDRAFT_46796 [Aspergillus versicolor CBS 583.65]OJJ07493.1 hypothetical protein ASPVEDRAFT_46796 [Aspergillus versicolor CBS 583.65]
MPHIQTVAVAGATGTLGPRVVQALIEADFQITILTRKKSGAYRSGVKVFEVDFGSLESLTRALEGIDAVVSMVGGPGIDNQPLLIDAAVAAGVKRFIPSEFGSVTTNPELEEVFPYSSFSRVRKYLQSKAEAGDLSWTVLRCGAFLDFLLNTPTLLDWDTHTVTTLDDGENRISSTSMPMVGRGVAGILRNFEATKNKVMRISEIILTQNQLVEFANELRPGINWTATDKVSTAVLLQEGLDQIAAGDVSLLAMMKVIKGTGLAGDIYGAAYDVTDNELLGIRELTPGDLKRLVAEKLAEA